LAVKKREKREKRREVRSKRKRETKVMKCKKSIHLKSSFLQKEIGWIFQKNINKET